MRFEWDENKRDANLAKHALDFVRAHILFDGRYILTKPALRGGEPRSITTGVLDGRMVTLVWTDRDGAIRVISLRRARRGEERAYRARFG